MNLPSPSRRLFTSLLAAIAALQTHIGYADQLQHEDDLRAALVLGFARFSEWPVARDGPIIIAVVGRPAMAAALERVSAGKVVNELKGFQLTMLIFAVLSVVMFLICFATTKERVTVPPGQKSDAWGEVKELLRNYPWVMLLLSAIFSLTFIGLRNGSAIYYFKYVAGYDNQPVLFGQFDRFTLFISLGMACQMLGS